MKLWKKIFLGMFIIFVIAFDMGAFMLTSYSYNYSRDREIETGIREQSVILSSVTSSILRAEEFNPDIFETKYKLSSIIKSLADYYEQQGVQLALLSDNETIYSDITDIDEQLLKFSDSTNKNVMDKKVDERRYLFVSSQIPDYPELIFVYSRDINNIEEFRADISNFFIVLNVIVIILMSISVFLLLKRMTRPIALLSKMTSEIADGSYNKRVTIKRSDELGELAENFNIMADSVEKTMIYLKKSAEDKQQFIDDLAHEMKTPVTAISGYAEYLKSTNSSKENQIIALEHLQNATQRLQNLSEEMLKLTLLREEKIEFKPVLISDLFTALEETMKPILQKRNMNLITETDIDCINGDEALLLSLLTNLVENAARASKSGDKIIVRAYNDEFPVIEVKDEGIGMMESEIQKITAPFYRVDKSRSREFGGIGLGLSIVAKIADLHNADLKIKSQENVGTTVEVIFTTS
ncbi:MAG: HAMP domain-containing histidine kinase [Ruminococcus sp.]|nr:HAMP domain-containing histidine kinase [Ruminococcus sp.]